MNTKTFKKAATYRVLSLFATAGTAFVLTGNIGAALGMGFLDGLFKFGLYAAHEAAWNRFEGDVAETAGTADTWDAVGLDFAEAV